MLETAVTKEVGSNMTDISVRCVFTLADWTSIHHRYAVCCFLLVYHANAVVRN